MAVKPMWAELYSKFNCKTREGQRFQDESRGYLACTHKMVEKGYKVGYWIFDAKTFEKYRNGCLKPLFETEVVHEYPTLETLAKGEKINVDGLLPEFYSLRLHKIPGSPV